MASDEKLASRATVALLTATKDFMTEPGDARRHAVAYLEGLFDEVDQDPGRLFELQGAIIANLVVIINSARYLVDGEIAVDLIESLIEMHVEKGQGR
jgi:hypothetical protein